MSRACLLLGCLLGSAAAAGERPDAFHERSAEGWYWYEVLSAEPEPTPVEPTAPVPEVQRDEEAPIASTAAGPADPTPLSSAWLRENLGRYRDAAVDDPTPAKVRAYLLLQRIALDRASAFARRAQAVTLGDPLLDANAERPIAGFGAEAMDAEAHRARRALLGALSDRAGLVFFYSSTCPYCERQAPLLGAIARGTGLEILAVALDGRPLPSGAFEGAWVPDRGQAAALGVTTVPAVALMAPPDAVRLVGQGLMTQTDLERRILLTAKDAGWVSEEAWETTLPVRRATAAVDPAELDAALLDDPAALAAWLTRAMGATR